MNLGDIFEIVTKVLVEYFTAIFGVISSALRTIEPIMITPYFRGGIFVALLVAYFTHQFLLTNLFSKPFVSLNNLEKFKKECSRNCYYVGFNIFILLSFFQLLYPTMKFALHYSVVVIYALFVFLFKLRGKSLDIFSDQNEFTENA